MKSPLILSILSAFIVSLLSLIGIVFLFFRIKTRKLIEVLVGFATGALFGDVFFHIIPEAIEEIEPVNFGIFILFGIFLFFILEEVICWRHCHLETTKEHPHPVAFMNLVGDTLHNLLDGLAIGISFLTSFSLGIATTLAIIFHEIPQEIGDFSILVYAGFSKTKALLFNFITAVAAMIGVVIPFIFKISSEHLIYFLPLIAGGFIYIAGSDLVPLIKNQKSVKNSLIYLIMMVLGSVLMYLLLFFE